VLVLSRRRHEKIVIGDEITVTVLEVHGDQVQLGIEAPRHIPVHRHEIYQAIQRGESPSGGVTPTEAGEETQGGLASEEGDPHP